LAGRAGTAKAAPGVDIYFDNVGGDILDAVLPHLNMVPARRFAGNLALQRGGAPRAFATPASSSKVCQAAGVPARQPPARRDQRSMS
jgi:hypothetical protein